VSKSSMTFDESIKSLSAGFTLSLFIQFFPADAHPADLFGGIAHHEGMVWDILGNHRPGADEGVFSDGVAADDGAVGPKSGAFFDKGNRGVRVVFGHLLADGAGLVADGI
jgi:hypothetical protein